MHVGYECAVRSVAGLVTAWVLLAVAGVAVMGVAPALPAATATAAVAGVYALLGTPELVHVLYELARGQINIHALTTVAVFGALSYASPPCLRSESWTAYNRCKHSGYIAECPCAAHCAWDGPRRPAHTCQPGTPV